ncbi:MAG TPA: hypothetical protein PLG47_02945 [Candidatus Dojkabacteria bacterium]|nr:hypothetical protein [Candidatus Dojkabacteria bacterium]
MSDKTIVHKVESYKYRIPLYTVVEGKGIELKDNPRKLDIDGNEIIARDMAANLYVSMLRGSKIEGENVLPKIDGVLVEQLLEVCLLHLKEVNVGELATRETSLAITAIEEAQLRLLQREINRKKNNVLGTYQK